MRPGTRGNRPDDPDVPSLGHRLLRTISERIRWREQIAEARRREEEVSSDA
jgi:hypothetical protein